MSDPNWKQILHMRGVHTPCDACHGLGIKVYASTATWHGGMGCAAMTHDVCDECWGSGDKNRHGMDLRKMTAERKQWEKEQAMSYLSTALGVRIGRLRKRFLALANLADAQCRKRKLPAGEDEFWWQRDWECVASLLRSIAKKGDEPSP